MAATSTYMSYCKRLWTLFCKKRNKVWLQRETSAKALSIQTVTWRRHAIWLQGGFFKTSMTNYSSPPAQTTCGYVACGAVTSTYFHMKHARGIISNNIWFHSEPLICLKYRIIIYKLSSMPLIRIDCVINRLNWLNPQLFWSTVSIRTHCWWIYTTHHIKETHRGNEFTSRYGWGHLHSGKRAYHKATYAGMLQLVNRQTLV